MNKGKAESEVLKECLFVLKRHKIFSWRQNTGAFKTEGGGFVSSKQQDFLFNISVNHGVAVICRSGKELEDSLRRLGYGQNY